MLTFFNEYKMLIVLGSLFFITIPGYIFIHSVRNKDRLNIIKQKKLKQEQNKPIEGIGSEDRNEEHSEADLVEKSNELADTANSQPDSFEDLTNEELTKYYRTLRLQLPDVDELVRRKLMTKEQGQQHRNKMKTILLILKERSENNSQDDKETTR